MKIATMVTGNLVTPQPFGVTYAPIDIAVAISEGLQALGHQVDYYGPEGSSLGVPVVSCGLKPFPKNDQGLFVYPNAPGEEGNLSRIWDEYLISEMVRRAINGDYDILLIHPVDRGIMFGRVVPNIPIVYTLHDPILPWRSDIFSRFLTPNQHLISITDAQRRPAPDLPYLATIYNSIDVDAFPFVKEPSNYVMFAGRLVPEKNPADAIKAARLANTPIRLFGEIPGYGYGPKYFDNEIKPQLDESVIYGGFLERKQLAQEYGMAKALLVPIKWEEPFGLVLIEAMACGTPVIAFRRGSVPEVIVDGKTGFIVDTVEEMAEAIKKIDTIDRQACRDHVLEKFSNQRMVEKYETVLRGLLPS
jgi:glycosyltransferase involved in cell wall biosynthesis